MRKVSPSGGAIQSLMDSLSASRHNRVEVFSSRSVGSGSAMAFSGPAMAVVMAFMILIGFGFGKEALAASMHSTAALSAGATWSQDPGFGNSVWVRSNFSGIPGTFGGGASGVVLDEWNVLVSGHQVFSNGNYAMEMMIGTGSNWMSDPGDTFITPQISIHPGWDGTLFSQRIDLAMLHFPSGIPGMDSLDIAGTTLNQRITAVGVGQPATGNGTWYPVDGAERACYWFVDQYGNGATVSTNYIRSNFHPTFIRNEPMAGGGTPGDSGGGVYDANGDLVALAVGFGGTMPSYGYASFALRLGLPITNDWIEQTRIVPEPATLSLLLLGSMALLKRRR